MGVLIHGKQVHTDHVAPVHTGVHTDHVAPVHTGVHTAHVTLLVDQELNIELAMEHQELNTELAMEHQEHNQDQFGVKEVMAPQ